MSVDDESAGPSASIAAHDERERQEVSTQFQQMLNVSSDVAEQYLSRCNYSLELAAQDYFNAQEGRPSNLAGTADAAYNVNPSPNYGVVADAYERQNVINEGIRHRFAHTDDSSSSSDGGRAARRPNRVTGAVQLSWPQWAFRWLTVPLHMIWSTWSGILQMLLNLIFGGGRQQRAMVGANDPMENVDDVQAFVQRYNATYGENHVPFHICSYKQLMTTIRADIRYAVVYIHSWIHEDSHDLCRDTMSSARLQQWFADNDVLLWAIDAQSRVGGRVSQAMHESRYPSLSLLAMRDGRQAMIVRMNGLAGNDPSTTDAAIIYLLQQALNDNAPYMNAARLLREQRNADTLLRAEQQRAYEETMEHDRQMQRHRDAEVARQADEEAAIERERLKEEHREQRRAMLREYLSKSKHDVGKDCTCRVGVSMPNGTRLTLHIRPTDALYTIYAHCLSTISCPLAVSLWTAHPRTALEWRPKWLNDLSWLDDDTPIADVVAESQSSPSVGELNLHGQMIYVQDDDA